MSNPLASERIIINAPMSFAGAAQRTWRLIGRLSAKLSGGRWLHWLVVVPLGVVLLLAPWWSAVALWYLTFGIFLIPYRLLRRGARKRKAEAHRHREILQAMQNPPHGQP